MAEFYWIEGQRAISAVAPFNWATAGIPLPVSENQRAMAGSLRSARGSSTAIKPEVEPCTGSSVPGAASSARIWSGWRLVQAPGLAVYLLRDSSAFASSL